LILALELVTLKSRCTKTSWITGLKCWKHWTLQIPCVPLSPVLLGQYR